MRERVEELKKEIADYQATSAEELEAYRMRFVSKKSVFAELFQKMKEVTPAERKQYGLLINDLKKTADDKFKKLIAGVNQSSAKKSADQFDVTLPPISELGAVHPISSTRARIVQIFEQIGFNISHGPEIEDDWHNFSALNFPENHPAREMQDTFFINRDPDVLLRTHTSSVQVRVMENTRPPLRTLSLGRVFRNEAISARAHCIFHQCEGLFVDTNVSFVDLKQTLYYFAREMFSKDIKVRYRPSYFPFTEPSAEIDISCNICKGEGCSICKYTGWVEIAGSGMVDPNVLENCGIDSNKYTGFAFGMGIERIAQLKYQVNDLRLYTENDVRFLRQFRTL